MNKRLVRCEGCGEAVLGTARRRFCSDACRKRRQRGTRPESPIAERLSALTMKQRRDFADFLEQRGQWSETLPPPLAPSDLALPFCDAVERFGEKTPELAALGWVAGDRLNWFLAEESDDPDLEFDRLRAERRLMREASNG